MVLINALVDSFEKWLKLVIQEGGKQIGCLINKYNNDIEVDLDLNVENIAILIPINPELEGPKVYNKSPYSIEEDKLLLEIYINLGSRWN